jgi:hypothetical protein
MVMKNKISLILVTFLLYLFIPDSLHAKSYCWDENTGRLYISKTKKDCSDDITESYSEGGRILFSLSDFNKLFKRFYHEKDYTVQGKFQDWYVDCYEANIVPRLNNISKYIKSSAVKSVDFNGFHTIGFYPKIVWSEGVGGVLARIIHGDAQVWMVIPPLLMGLTCRITRPFSVS